MSSTKAMFLAVVLLTFVGCRESKEKNENNPSPTPVIVSSPKEDKPCEALQQSCEGGKLLVRHAYSKCCFSVWHVVEDAYYNCPPVKTFRVYDKKTEQACEGNQAPPEGLGPYSDIKDLCNNPMDTGEKITITECFHGHWRTAVYTVYKCPDGGAKGIHKDHPDSAKEYQQACTEPMPSFTPPNP